MAVCQMFFKYYFYLCIGFTVKLVHNQTKFTTKLFLDKKLILQVKTI
jgi:hypothetical protein